MPVKLMSSYKNWKPLVHSVIQDEALKNQIHEKGYAIVPFLNEVQLKDIQKLYTSEHKLNIPNGGMFYSLYSKDLEYRKRVHETIATIVEPLLKKYFKNYKNIVNTFITKASGAESEFYVHQDTSALNEFEHSPLSVWIPLQDITPNNGAMAVIEKTHWFFSPYRGVSFAFPFQKINSTLKEYLKPIYLKAGEALLFDPRIVHNSMMNTSGKDRLVALCGVFPEKADFISCYKSKEPGAKIELIQQTDSFILKHENFFYDCHSKPKTGKVIEKIDDDFPEMSAQTFEKLCEINSIKKENILKEIAPTHCKFIAEPNGVNLDMVCDT